jgi:hypothetical protein
MEPIQVAVLDEHQIFRRGVVASLEAHPGLAVAVEAASGPVEVDVDVAFASAGCAAREALPCPVVVYAPQPAVPEDARVGNRVMGVLAVDGLTPDRLAGAARAAAAGLEVRVEEDGEQDIDPRSLAILRLLADGADTRIGSESHGQEPAARLAHHGHAIGGNLAFERRTVAPRLAFRPRDPAAHLFETCHRILHLSLSPI